jgi:hypothetical protein
MKKRWQARRRAAGLPTDKPNIVMSSAVQVCGRDSGVGRLCSGAPHTRRRPPRY